MKAKRKIIIIIISLLLVLAVLLAYFVFRAVQDKKPDFISAELGHLAISVKGAGEESTDFLDNYDPAVLEQLCTDAGYDYKPYLGKEINFVSYKTNSFYASGEEKHPLKVGIFSYNDKIVCVYFLGDFENDPKPLMPGVFPVNDKSVIKN